MIEYEIEEVKIGPLLKPYLRKFSSIKAIVKTSFDQPFYPIGYVRLAHTISGNASISIQERNINKEPIVEGPYFSGLIDGDNAYMHFTKNHHWTGTDLQAGMGYYLFHLDIGNLKNVTTHFSNISPIAEDFNKACIQAKSLDEVYKAHCDFILNCANKRLPAIEYIDDAVSLIESRNGAISIQEILDNVYVPVSERHFTRTFKKVIGLNPKHWCRVLQINYAFELLQSEVNLTEIALKAGFYDQAHFIKSFQDFLRKSPREFLENEETDIVEYLFRKGE